MQGNVEKISLSKCKSILQKDGSVYSDQDIIDIREFLYMLAKIEHGIYLRDKIRELEFENEKTEQQENSELKNAA